MASKRASTAPMAPPKPPAATDAPTRRPLTSRERAVLRGMTLCDERTIKRWWVTPGKVHPAIKDRLDLAAVQARIEP